MSDEAALIELIDGCAWLMEALEVVEQSGLPDVWVAAGVVRDLVWDTRFGGGFSPERVKDVDVCFFDPSDLSRRRDQQAEAALMREGPSFSWDAKNQAAVHLWYQERFGLTVEPLASALDGVATFPETATAVAVRLGETGPEVFAPFGLRDLMEGVWRRNPRRVTAAEYLARLDRKQPAERWPAVTVLGPDD